MADTKQRSAALILEIELPEFYAEDMRADNPDWQRWLEMVDVDPADTAAVGQEILNNIGEVYSGLLTVRTVGEKSSEIVRTPVKMVGARVEDRPPADHEDHLADDVDEPHRELLVEAKTDEAARRVFERFARMMAREYTGQVAELAQQALQEARMAEDEAEARWER